MFQIDATEVGAPGAVQVWQFRARRPMPPQPEGLRLARLLRQAADLDQQPGPAHNRAPTSRIAQGVLTLRLPGAARSTPARARVRTARPPA